MKLQIPHHMRVERVDDEIIVLDRAGAVVRHATGDAVEALRLATDGIDDSEIPPRLAGAMASLVDAGVVTASTWSRRKLLMMGAAGVAGAGIITVATPLPAAAAASSCTAADGDMTAGPGDNLATPVTYSTGHL